MGGLSPRFRLSEPWPQSASPSGLTRGSTGFRLAYYSPNRADGRDKHGHDDEGEPLPGALEAGGKPS